MLKEKSKSKYKDHEETIDHLLAYQEYMIDSSDFFIECLDLEKNLKREEGRRLKNKSIRVREMISDENNVKSDFISIITHFVQLFESTGSQENKNYAKYEQNANYFELVSICKGVKESKNKSNKDSIMDKLAPLSKMRNSRSKKQYQYETAVTTAEEVLRNSAKILNDPDKAYEFSKKETAENKAVSAIKNLDDSKAKLQEHMVMLNEYQKTCVDIIEDLISKTDQSVDSYLKELLSLWVVEINNQEENLESLENLSLVRTEEFVNYDLISILTSKMGDASARLKVIKEALETEDSISLEKLKEYKEYIFTYIKNEKLEFEQSYYLIYQFKKYISVMIEIKESAQKKISKIMKMVKKKVGNGNNR